MLILWFLTLMFLLTFANGQYAIQSGQPFTYTGNAYAQNQPGLGAFNEGSYRSNAYQQNTGYSGFPQLPGHTNQGLFSGTNRIPYNVNFVRNPSPLLSEETASKYQLSPAQLLQATHPTLSDFQTMTRGANLTINDLQSKIPDPSLNRYEKLQNEGRQYQQRILTSGAPQVLVQGNNGAQFTPQVTTYGGRSQYIPSRARARARPVQYVQLVPQSNAAPNHNLAYGTQYARVKPAPYIYPPANSPIRQSPGNIPQQSLSDQGIVPQQLQPSSFIQPPHQSTSNSYQPRQVSSSVTATHKASSDSRPLSSTAEGYLSTLKNVQQETPKANILQLGDAFRHNNGYKIPLQASLDSHGFYLPTAQNAGSSSPSSIPKVPGAPGVPRELTVPADTVGEPVLTPPETPLSEPEINHLTAWGLLDALVQKLEVTCNTMCRSMEVKMVFTYQYKTRVKITTVGPQNQNDNCFFEGRNLDRGFFSIAMYGCNTKELVSSQESRYENSLVVQVQKPNGLIEIENYPISCSIPIEEREEMIRPIAKLLNENSQGTPPHIAIPNHCIHVDEVKNKLYVKPPGDACILNEQCPDNGLCKAVNGMRKCTCEHGYMEYNGYCMAVARNGDPCESDFECSRPGARSFKCTESKICEIASSYGDFCIDNSDCGSPGLMCDFEVRKCSCLPNVASCS